MNDDLFYALIPIQLARIVRDAKDPDLAGMHARAVARIALDYYGLREKGKSNG